MLVPLERNFFPVLVRNLKKELKRQKKRRVQLGEAAGVQIEDTAALAAMLSDDEDEDDADNGDASAQAKAGKSAGGAEVSVDAVLLSTGNRSSKFSFSSLSKFTSSFLFNPPPERRRGKG